MNVFHHHPKGSDFSGELHFAIGNHALDNLPPAEIANLNEGRDVRPYAKYMRDQVRELLGTGLYSHF